MGYNKDTKSYEPVTQNGFDNSSYASIKNWFNGCQYERNGSDFTTFKK